MVGPINFIFNSFSYINFVGETSQYSSNFFCVPENHNGQGDVDIDRCSVEGNRELKIRDNLRYSSSSQNGSHNSNISPKTNSHQQQQPPSPQNSSDSTTSSRPNATQVMKKKGSKEDRMRMRSKCNCDELKIVECVLETKDLWDKFHDLETEMIITKTGRYVMPLCTLF